MFQHTDPIIIKFAERNRRLERDNPHRDWKYNLSPEQIARIEDWRKESIKNGTDLESVLKRNSISSGNLTN